MIGRQSPAPKSNRWYDAAGGAVLACVVFFGIPGRRRGWRSMLGILLLLAAVAGGGCGNNVYRPPTTTGAYTFTVTGTDSSQAGLTGTATITVSVQ